MQPYLDLGMSVSGLEHQPVTQLLARLGFLRILDLPMVPVANAASLFYPEQVVVTPGDKPWFVRSYGTEFSLMAPKWCGTHRAGYRHYSLGWGLMAGSQRPGLLLAQASDVSAAALTQLEAALWDGLQEHITRMTSVVRHWYQRMGLFVAADLAVEGQLVQAGHSIL